MIEVSEGLKTHLLETSYRDSEVIYLHRDASNQEFSLLLFDASDLLPEALGIKKSRRDYYIRYVLFQFYQVENFSLEYLSPPRRSVPGVHYFDKTKGLQIDIFETDQGGKVFLGLDRALGDYKFNYGSVRIFQIPIYSKPIQGGFGLFLSLESNDPFDRDSFLDLVNESPLLAIKAIES
jgi:hypothetical protein